MGITIANSVCSPGVKNPDVARGHESKTSDIPTDVDSNSSTTQVSSLAESSLEAHATRQELKPPNITGPQNLHGLLCALTDDCNYMEDMDATTSGQS